jgi:hypothetical protein
MAHSKDLGYPKISNNSEIKSPPPPILAPLSWKFAFFSFTLYFKVLSNHKVMPRSRHIFSFHKGYFWLSVLLFIIEVLIARYLHDEFIRPIGGDYLVVILLYGLVRSFTDLPVGLTAGCVLLFAYVIETTQYFHLADRLGFTQPSLMRTVLGSYFSWGDMLAYTLGIGTILLLERIRIKPKPHERLRA